MTTSYKSDNDRINQINQMSKSYILLDFHVSSSLRKFMVNDYRFILIYKLKYTISTMCKVLLKLPLQTGNPLCICKN